MLSDLSRETETGGASLIVADHFRKTSRQDLDLDSIAQAGMGAWAGSWILQTHRRPPEVNNGDFFLVTEFGSREGYGRRWNLDWHVGAFDENTGEHRGSIAWAVEPHDDAATGERQESRILDEIAAFLQEHPDGVTKTTVWDAKDADGEAHVRGQKRTKDAVWQKGIELGHIVDSTTGAAPIRGSRVAWVEGKYKKRDGRYAREDAPRPDPATSTGESDTTTPARRKGGKGRKKS